MRELQKAARQERIQKLIAQADLNPDWIFDKMDSGDPALQYPIETARYFISGFEHWGRRAAGLHADLRRLRHWQIHPGGCRGPRVDRAPPEVGDLPAVGLHRGQALFNVIQDQEERNQYRRALEEVDLLIIDEVAANRAKMAESQSSFLGHLLRRRRNLSKSVIIITNHSPPQSLHQAIGDFSYEAIKAFNPVDIHLSGPSRRPSIGHYNG